MPLWTSSETMAATGGECRVPWDAQGVSIDTRTLDVGDLFVALSAERDGHDFVAQALANGAAAALVTHRPERVGEDAALLIVPDDLEGLIALGRAARARSEAQVIAVTRSVCKNYTKEILKNVPQ